MSPDSVAVYLDYETNRLLKICNLYNERHILFKDKRSESRWLHRRDYKVKS